MRRASLSRNPIATHRESLHASLIATRCLAAFPNAVDYESFWIKHKAASFTSNPLGLIQRLREMPADEVLRRQQAMDRYRSDILYDAPPWRMGDHLLRSAAQCARRRLGDSRVSRCRLSAQQRAAPHLAAQQPARPGEVMVDVNRTDARSTALAAIGAAAAAGGCDCATRSRSAACAFGRLCELSSSSIGHDARGRDGTARDGRLHDGKAHDGKAHDGKSHDGRSHDGKVREGKAHDGKQHDGKLREGKAHDAKARDDKLHVAKPHDAKSHGNKPDTRMHGLKAA